MKKLTTKESLFVDYYLVDLNASEAARKAGYSEKTAGTIASQVLARPHVAAAIQKAMQRRSQRTEVTQDRVLQELARIMFFDPRRMFDAAGNPIPINELDDDTAAAIAGVEVLEEYEGYGKDRKFIGYTKKYRLFDKNTALTNGMKHLGMLKDKIEHSGEVTVEIVRYGQNPAS